MRVDLWHLSRPVVGAPMAGGPSTPELAAAVTRAGGLGFLAAGYRTPPELTAQIRRTRDLGADVFGVNLFLPDPVPVDVEAADAYRQLLLPLAARLGVELPQPRGDDDAFEAKVGALLDDPVAVVSFTFGCPPAAVVSQLRQVGTASVACVTSADEATAAAAAGVDALVVQGPQAGGHRATFEAGATPSALPLADLLDSVRAVTDLPLIAAGGLTTPAAVRSALGQADAVQCGTAFLLADEAGTSAAHRRALQDARFTETTVTRAFSGRSARALRNGFIDDFGALAPAAYPALHHLTAPLRRAAAGRGDIEMLALWAGSQWRAARAGSAAEIIDHLLH